MSIMYKVWFVAVVFATVLSAVYSYATPSEQCPGMRHTILIILKQIAIT